MSKKKDKAKRAVEDEDEEKEERPLGDGIDFNVNPESVKHEYTRVPSFIATLNAVYAQALRKSILAKFNRDRTFALISGEIVDNAASNGDKKPAEQQIKNAVLLDDRYVAAVHSYAAAEEAKALAGGRAQAMIAKKEMLVSLGAHVRKELEGQPGGLDTDDDDDTASTYEDDDED